MLKKILAASTASVLALTALAATAMADDATATAKDDYTLELVPGKYTTSWTDPTTAHITATLKSGDIKNLLIPADKAVAKADIPALANFTEPTGVSGNYAADGTDAGSANKYAWIDTTTKADSTNTAVPTVINVKSGITEGAELIQWTDTTTTPPTYNVINSIVGLGNMVDSVNPYSTLAMGLSVNKKVAYTDNGKAATYDPTADGSFAMTNITLEAEIAGVGTDKTLTASGVSEKVDQKRTAKATASFADIKGGATPTGLYAATGTNDYLTTDKRALELSFGLSASKLLQRLDPSNSTFTVSFDLSLSNDSWAKLAKAANVNWNETNAEWSTLKIEELLNKSGDQIISTFLGIEGTSVLEWAVDANGGDLQIGKMHINSLGKTVATDVKSGETHYADNQNWFASGVTQAAKGGAFNNAQMDVTIGLGVASNKVLENLNNGGTVTFEFDKAIRPQDVFNPYIICWGNSGTPINLPLTLENTYEAGSNSITLKLPSGLTWATGNTNFYNSFKMQYCFNYVNILNNTNVSMPALGVDTAATNDLAEKNNFFKDAVAGDKDAVGNDNYGAKLVKITFKANKEAGNGGLVDPGNSGNSGNGNTPTNSGSNGGDEKNPGTGVAVAVAPVILAAAGAAVVISKKRK